MAIDPKILMMALHSAPQIIAALKGTVHGPTAAPAIEEALSRGYDPGLLEQSFNRQTDIGLPTNSALEVLNNNIGKHLNISDGVTEADFPSDFTSGVNLVGQAEQMQKFPGLASLLEPNATNAAASMIAKGLPTDEQIVNPSTGMSPLDWEWNELEQLNSPVARDMKANELARRENAKIGLNDLFSVLVKQDPYK